jgi:hypothetical protein
VPRGQRDGSLRPYSRFSRPEQLLFLSSSSSVVFTRLSGARSFGVHTATNPEYPGGIVQVSRHGLRVLYTVL